MGPESTQKISSSSITISNEHEAQPETKAKVTHSFLQAFRITHMLKCHCCKYKINQKNFDDQENIYAHLTKENQRSSSPIGYKVELFENKLARHTSHKISRVG